MKSLQVMAGARHGGAETAFIDMCLALHEAGHDLEVVTRKNDRNKRLFDAGINVHTLPFGGKIDIWTPVKLKQIIADYKPDVVQTWMSRAAQKIPKHDMSDYKVISRLGNYYKIKNFKNTDFFTTITPDIRTYLIDNGVPAENVRHINNFAETENVEEPLNRTDFDTPDDAPLLLALGRLHEAKAFDTLMDAIVNIPEAYLWIAGEGPQREALEKHCQDRSLNDRVRFLGWRNDRAALFQAADICVFSSRYEPFGTVFVQAWAQKIPLVTTDADGPRQFVKDGDDGLVVPIDNVSAMETAIKTLIKDKKLRQWFVSNGHKRYLSEFTKEKTVQAYLNLYEEL